jgi:hypothetical protein
MKVAIARALVHDPSTIMLDEPTNGLDIMSVRALRDQLRALRSAGRCLLFSSHVMQEVAALCDRIVILSAGKVIAHGTAQELLSWSGGATLEMRSSRCSAAGKVWRREESPHARGYAASLPTGGPQFAPRGCPSALMTARRIFAIARKEIVDSARDRRTLLVALLTAVAAGPIFLILIFNLIARQADSARELKLPAIGLSNAPALEAFLVRNQVTLSEAPADYEAKIRAGEITWCSSSMPTLRKTWRRAAKGACASSRIVRAIAHSLRSGRPSLCCARTTGCGAGSGSCCEAFRPPSAILSPSRTSISRHRSSRARSCCSSSRFTPSSGPSWAAWRFRSIPRRASASGNRSSPS